MAVGGWGAVKAKGAAGNRGGELEQRTYFQSGSLGLTKYIGSF